MELADYAKQMGVLHQTAWHYLFDGKVQGRRIGPHTIVIAKDPGNCPRIRCDRGEREGAPMQLVERHTITCTDPRFAAIVAAAFASKNLYNAANYFVRQSFLLDGVYLDYCEIHRRMKDHEACQALPAKVAQWVLRQLDKNWQSFFAAFAAWQEDPSQFLGRPKLPSYKDKLRGRNLLVYTIQAL